MFSVFLYPIKGIQKTQATNAITANLQAFEFRFKAETRQIFQLSLAQLSSEINQQMPLNYYVNYNFLLSAVWEGKGGGRTDKSKSVKVISMMQNCMLPLT